MKKLLAALFTLALAVSLSVPVFAAPGAQDTGSSSSTTMPKKKKHSKTHHKKKKHSTTTSSGTGSGR
ncbi:MAG: hypothetical protein ACRD3D_12705 [Terriglobia bacterium]